MIKYSLTVGNIMIDGCSITSYGIKATHNELTEKIFEDVSVDMNFVMRLVDKLNENEVELCHFNDVVIDEITLEYM